MFRAEKIRRTAVFAAGIVLVGGLAAGVAQAAVSVVVVDQVRQRFSKSVVSILPGDAVHFVNTDDVKHNIRVFSSDDSETDKGIQDPDQVIELKLDKSGTYVVRCAIHQKMKMKIEVR